MLEGQVLKTDTAWTSTNNNVCYYSSTDKEIRALSPGKATMTSSGGQVTITVSSSSGLIGTAAQPGYLHIDVATKAGNQKPIMNGDIVVVARSQVGYHEGSRMVENGVTMVKFPTGGNWVKYWYLVYGKGYSSNDVGAWCACFVTWCGETAGIPDKVPKQSYVGDMAAWYDERGRYHTYSNASHPLARGDIVFFGTTHVGICTWVNPNDTNEFKYIDGNSANNNVEEKFKSVRMGVNASGFGKVQ